MVHKVKVGGHDILYLFDFVRRGFWEVCLLIKSPTNNELVPYPYGAFFGLIILRPLALHQLYDDSSCMSGIKFKPQYFTKLLSA